LGTVIEKQGAPVTDEASRRALQLVELQSLRAELNSVIDRMNSNENFAAGSISAIFAFVLSQPISIISLFLGVASILILLIGERRYRELRFHIRKIDKYVSAIENELSPTGGWTTFYYHSISGSSTGGYSFTRFVFWFGLMMVSLGGTIVVARKLAF
jgi:uncharacterized membrane protein